MSKKSPQLRFEGFTDDWEERKLRDLLNKNSEKNKNLSVINVESVSNKTGFTKQTDQFEDYSVASADLSNYYVIREKQFAYNPSRINVGSIAYKDLGDEISVVSPLYVSFSTKKVLNDGFLWNWFKTASFDAQRQRLSEGGVRDTLSFNQLSEMNTMFPTYPEQEKIGSFFQQLDETIALHQRKLDLLKEQKKGFLQKMFPKNGAKVPELRFAGFADDWEERKLGDISYKVKEKNKTGEFTETLTNSAEYGIINQRDFFDKDISNAKNLTGYYVVKNDDFVYNPRISNFAPVGPIKRNKLGRTGVMSPLYYVFRAHDIDKNYFEKYFDTVYWHRFMELNGDSGARADRFAIKDSVFVEMPIPYPTMDEQQKIGSFFQQLDNTITLHQLKLDLLKEQKKGFLQKMFA